MSQKLAMCHIIAIPFQVRSIVFPAGLTIQFGAMFAKTFRVYIIFRGSYRGVIRKKVSSVIHSYFSHCCLLEKCKVIDFKTVGVSTSYAENVKIVMMVHGTFSRIHLYFQSKSGDVADCVTFCY